MRRKTQPARSAQAAREVRRDSALRKARTCYDHLAGVEGVGLLDAMLTRCWLEAERGPRTLYHLTTCGERALTSLGVDVSGAVAQRRPFAYGCLDWTERRHHLRGALAAVILAALSNAGTINRVAGTRAVSINYPLSHWMAHWMDSIGTLDTGRLTRVSG